MPPLVGMNKKPLIDGEISMETKKRPTVTQRFGNIEAALWANETKDGIIHNVTFSRVYKNAEGQLRSAGSCGRRDIFNLVRGAVWAYAQMGERRAPAGTDIATPEDHLAA